MTTPDISELSRVDRAKLAVQQLTNTEFKSFRTWVALDEANRREREDAAAAGQVALYRQMREAGILPTPDPEDAWAAPDGLVRVWLPGDRTTHGGRRWQSVHDGLNDEEPGTGDKWTDITPPEPEPESDLVAQETAPTTGQEAQQ